MAKMAASDDGLRSEVGSRLRLAREALRMTQAEFAKQADIAANAYNQFEQGRRMLPPASAIAICDAHGLTTDWLYRGDPGNLPYKLGNAIKALQEVA